MLPSWSCASPRLCSAASDEAQKACTRYYIYIYIQACDKQSRVTSHLLSPTTPRVPREILVPRTHVNFTSRCVFVCVCVITTTTHDHPQPKRHLSLPPSHPPPPSAVLLLHLVASPPQRRLHLRQPCATYRSPHDYLARCAAFQQLQAPQSPCTTILAVPLPLLCSHVLPHRCQPPGYPQFPSPLR